MVGHLLGPYTEKMNGVRDEFIKELGNEVSMFTGQNVAKVYMQAEIAMKPGNKAKYEEYVARYNEFYLGTDPPRGSNHKPEPHVKFYAHDDKIVVKFVLIFPESESPLRDFDIPAGLKEGLKDVDQ